MTIDDVKYSIKNHILNSISHRDLCSLCNIFGIPITSHQKINQKNLLSTILVSTDVNLLRHSLLMLNKTNIVSEQSAQVNQPIRYVIPNYAQNVNRLVQSNVPVHFSLNLRLYCLSNELIGQSPIDVRNELVAGVNPQNIFIPNFTKYPDGYFNAPSCAPVLINGRLNIPSVQLPYISKNTTIKASPFYCCQVVLHPLSLLVPKPTPNICQPSRIMAKMPLHFTISTSVRQLLNAHKSIVNSKPIYKWQVLLRFGVYDPLKPFPATSNDISSIEEYIPPYLSISVNNTTVPLWEILPSNTTCKEGKRHSRPINITDYIKYSFADNQGYRQGINVNWWQTPGLYLYYYAAVFLERKLDVRELLSQFVKKTHTVQRPISFTLDFIRDKFSSNTQFNRDDNDDDLIMSSVLPVSLLCPVGKSRITCPLRSINCQHLQCFDAYLYLMMNERRSVWKCPVCDGQATMTELFVDEYFQQILRVFEYDEEVTEVNVNPDGSYVAAAIKESREEKQHVGNIISQLDVHLDNSESSTFVSNENSTESQPVILLESDDEDNSMDIKSEKAPLEIASDPALNKISTNHQMQSGADACTIDLTSDSEDDPKAMEIDEISLVSMPGIVCQSSTSNSFSPITKVVPPQLPLFPSKLLPTITCYPSESVQRNSSIAKDNCSLTLNSLPAIASNQRLLIPNYPYKYISQSFITNQYVSLHSMPLLQTHQVAKNPTCIKMTPSSAILRNPVSVAQIRPPILFNPANRNNNFRQDSKLSSKKSVTLSSSSSSSSSSSEDKRSRRRILKVSRGSRRSTRIQHQNLKSYFPKKGDSDESDSGNDIIKRANQKRKRDNPFEDSQSSSSDFSNKKRKRFERESYSDNKTARCETISIDIGDVMSKLKYPTISLTNLDFVKLNSGHLTRLQWKVCSEDESAAKNTTKSIDIDDIKNKLKYPIICLTKLDPAILHNYLSENKQHE